MDRTLEKLAEQIPAIPALEAQMDWIPLAIIVVVGVWLIGRAFRTVRDIFRWSVVFRWIVSAAYLLIALGLILLFGALHHSQKEGWIVELTRIVVFYEGMYFVLVPFIGFFYALLRGMTARGKSS